jgi:hypothetical protein
MPWQSAERRYDPQDADEPNRKESNMQPQIPREWAGFTPFDPNSGTVIREPLGSEAGYWVGAPSVTYDPESAVFYLAYRIRRPRGVEPDRGAEIRIARSSDGVAFEDVWSGLKTTIGTTSIERCTLARLPQGEWGFYVSYVDPADGRWRIDVCRAASVEDLDFADRTPILTADDIEAEGVKDPFLFQIAGLYHMVASCAAAVGAPSQESMHGTSDAYNTGLIKSTSGLATSADGLNWEWQGCILAPSDRGWDRYCSRIGTIWREDGVWLAFYDGSADVSENYEERCGLAYSHDLRVFRRATPDGPLFVQPDASGACRYFDVLDVGSATYFYYETARRDGSHDLRVVRREATP